MHTRTIRNVAFALAAVAAAFVATGGFAGAEDEKPAGGHAMQMQKKVDHPLAKSLAGTWDVAHKSEQHPSTGTVKFTLGVGDTALMQDYEVSMGSMGAFVGHGVWKFSDDGKTLRCWWIDMTSAGMTAFEGTVSDTGFDVKAGDGTQLTLAKADKGFEFKLFPPGETAPAFTDTYTKKP
jgi:hypothetical protein